MNNAFLWLDLVLLLFPLLFAIDRKVFTNKILATAFLPSFIVTVIFSEVAIFFVQAKVWNFNPAALVGVSYRQLPLEAYLFIFAYSFATLNIYNYLNLKFPKDDLQKYSLVLSNLVLGLFVAVLFLAHNKWFPVVTVAIAAILLFGIEYINKLRFMYRFYRAFATSLLLFYIVFALLCNLPVLSYNLTETVGVSLFHIPLENHFYCFSMLLLGVYVLEYFKHRKRI